jgi:hypothetical protein
VVVNELNSNCLSGDHAMFFFMNSDVDSIFSLL